MTNNWPAFFEAARTWQLATFGDVSKRGPYGPLLHLVKEAKEALAASTDKPALLAELADVVFLAWEACHRSGFDDDALLGMLWQKLAVNKQRTWPPPTRDGAVEHVRE